MRKTVNQIRRLTMNNCLTEDTKVTTMLYATLGNEQVQKPLSLTQYSALVFWLMRANLRPKDLLQKEVAIAAGREAFGYTTAQNQLTSLLSRGVALAFAVEQWNRNGVWLISRSDETYPIRLKKHLKDKAPPLLFGVGSLDLLTKGGLGIVGSRNVDEAGAMFTQEVAADCAKNNITVVSGCARGVNQISMKAAFDAGGSSIGIVADSLLKKSVDSHARKAIADKRLLLLSMQHPNASFSVKGAMERNKLIYAMADSALVVSAEYQKGGTWAGAVEELKRKNARKVFVRMDSPQSNVPSGNGKLLDMGATSWEHTTVGTLRSH